jgi:hypothetical protein
MRELKSVKVISLSLVPEIKNNLPVFFPASDVIEFKNIVLNSADGQLTVIVLGLGERFLEGCHIAPDLLRDMAHEYLRSGAKLERYSTRKPLSSRDAAVVESFIVQPGDARFADLRDYENKPIDVTGAWAVVIKLFSKSLRELYRGMNAWNGVSVFTEAQFDRKPKISGFSPVSLKVAVL